MSGKVLSSIVPFCSFKSDLTLASPPFWLPNISFPLCSSFQPTILEGQLCYKIQPNATADQAKMNDLMMVLDYNEDRSFALPLMNDLTSDSHNMMTMNLDPAREYQHQDAKIHIEALSNFKGFGGGSYKMTAVKRMTATNAFLDMPFEDRGCEVELFQECKTRRLLEECKCVPWEVLEVFGTFQEHYSLPKGIKRCSPKGRDCIGAKSTQSFNCSFTCEGVHADIQQVEHNVMMVPTKREHANKKRKSNKRQQTVKGRANYFPHFLRMINEYKRFKKSLFTVFNFNAAANFTQFGNLS